MNTSILTVKTDLSTKQAVQNFADSLGISVSSLLNAQLKQMLRDRRVVLSTELEPTEYLSKIITQVEQDLKTGKNMSKAMNKQDALDYLDNL